MKTRTFKKLSDEQVAAIEAEVKMMLHSHRDTLRNQWNLSQQVGRNGIAREAYDPTKVPFNCNEGFYGEAFGIMRGLVTLGYGYFGSDNLDAVKEGRSDNPRHNCKWWFAELKDQVCKEENFGGSNECDYCLEHYGKDSAGRKKTS